MKEDIRRLPDSELEVMQAIWAFEPPVTRAQIEECLLPHYPIAQTTLLTLLTRLEQKRYIHADKEAKVRTYTPLVSRQEYLAGQGNRFFRKLCGGNVSAFANALCDSGLTKEELAQLRQLLERDEL